MDWWQVGSGVVGMLVTGGATVGFMWRIVRTEIGTLRTEIGTVRDESRKAHEQIGNAISEVRKELGGQIAEVRKELGGEIAELREGQASLREGIAGLQGEMKGMQQAVLTLRDDFRAHVLAEN